MYTEESRIIRRSGGNGIPENERTSAFEERSGKP
jgi:hypothetical protein